MCSLLCFEITALTSVLAFWSDVSSTAPSSVSLLTHDKQNIHPAIVPSAMLAVRPLFPVPLIPKLTSRFRRATAFSTSGLPSGLRNPSFGKLVLGREEGEPPLSTHSRIVLCKITLMLGLFLMTFFTMVGLNPLKVSYLRSDLELAS